MTQTQLSSIAEQRFLKSAMSMPLLEADHEQSLAIRWREENDEEALHELTSAYMRLVISIAGKFRKYGLPMSDLLQEGNIGLMQAAARFEPSREVRFSTYATWWIRAAIQDYVLRNWSIVRSVTTAAHKTLFFNLRRLRTQIDAQSDAALTPENRKRIARELRVRERDVETMDARLLGGDWSLNTPVGDEGDMEHQDLLVDDAPSPEDLVAGDRDAQTRKKWIRRALEKLKPREALIIRARLLSDEPQTLDTLGQQLDISKERVRQIERAALKKMHRILMSIADNGDELRGLMSAA